jgi:hypothetical protein
MSNDRNTVRVMSAISPELNEKLIALCKAYGMTKSGLMAYYIGKMVDTESRVQNLVSQHTIENLLKSAMQGEAEAIKINEK